MPAIPRSERKTRNRLIECFTEAGVLGCNREPIFHQQFFPTVQLLFAGSDSQGLRYE